MNKEIKKHWFDVSYIPLLLGTLLTVAIVFIIYTQTQNILKERLRERLIAIASTASLLIDPNEVASIKDAKDLNSAALANVVHNLRNIREKNKNLNFIYIFRPTGKPNVLAFVADADMLASLEELDVNGNGEIDEDEAPPMPGDEYDTSQIPKQNEVELYKGFNEATATEVLGSDKWGTYLSGFAPIKDNQGNTIAVIGLDVGVDDFNTIVRATLIPFAIQVLLFLTTLAVQTVALIRIWKNRVDIVNELDRQKDELLSIVSHQLATPITSIKWYLEMMMNGDLGALSDQMKEHVHSMQGIAINLVDLVGMILDVSRIQLGRMKVEKQKMDLDGFFKELIEVIEPRAIEKKVKFSKEIPASMPSAMLDKRYTRMTIENLLSNAVKYTPENGEVQLKVKVQNDKLYCEVSDTGMGIPKAEQDKIFGKLFRASNVRNSVDGNGFGLYVAKGAVESQGGAIRFTSTEGKGTTFYVELPLKD